MARYRGRFINRDKIAILMYDFDGSSKNRRLVTMNKICEDVIIFHYMIWRDFDAIYPTKAFSETLLL